MGYNTKFSGELEFTHPLMPRNEMNASNNDIWDAADPAVEAITAYKGFDKDFKCRGFQYKVGETFKYDGIIKACKAGFHACEYPLDIFRYYPPSGSRFAVVEQSGELSRPGVDTKVASSKIKINAEINFAGIVKAAIEYTKSRCNPIDPTSPAAATGYRGAAAATGDQGAASATGDHGAAAATGYRGAASATGDQGAAAATGDQGAASATGDHGAASATGNRGAAAATGDHGAASATGNRGAAAATGYRGAAAATGDQGAASATGDHGAAAATGDHGAASATGNRGAASATGNRGAASATGDHGAASATGKASVAVSTGLEGRAQATDGCAIVLVFRDDDGNIVHIRASKVGDNGVKPGVWYALDAQGEFVEIEDKVGESA